MHRSGVRNVLEMYRIYSSIILITHLEFRKDDNSEGHNPIPLQKRYGGRTQVF
jgi:hypothetical protein